jgi:predicted nuclease of predicted toxin-antitoxin system
MKILADENIPRDIVAWLRQTGNDVLFAAETQPGASDMDWLTRADQERRLIITSDKDYGELVFRNGVNTHGVVLLRLEDLPASQMLTRLQAVWSVVEANPIGRFIVITETRVRVRQTPSSS